MLWFQLAASLWNIHIQVAASSTWQCPCVNSPPRGPFLFRIPWSSFQKLEAIHKNHDCLTTWSPEIYNYSAYKRKAKACVSQTMATKSIPLACQAWFAQLTTSSFAIACSSTNKGSNNTKPHQQKTRQSRWYFCPPAVELCFSLRYFLKQPVHRNMAG